MGGGLKKMGKYSGFPPISLPFPPKCSNLPRTFRQFRISSLLTMFVLFSAHVPQCSHVCSASLVGSVSVHSSVRIAGAHQELRGGHVAVIKHFAVVMWWSRSIGTWAAVKPWP